MNEIFPKPPQCSLAVTWGFSLDWPNNNNRVRYFSFNLLIRSFAFSSVDLASCSYFSFYCDYLINWVKAACVHHIRKSIGIIRFFFQLWFNIANLIPLYSTWAIAFCYFIFFLQGSNDDIEIDKKDTGGHNCSFLPKWLAHRLNFRLLYWLNEAMPMIFSALRDKFKNRFSIRLIGVSIVLFRKSEWGRRKYLRKRSRRTRFRAQRTEMKGKHQNKLIKRKRKP